MPVLPGVTRVTSLTVLGVILTTGLSASDHVCDVITKSAQTLYALRVLRAKGMPDEALQVVFRSVIVGKLLYASCAWSGLGFVSHTDRKRVDAFLQRSKRCGFCPPDLSRFDEPLEDAHSTLFRKINADSRHVLHQLYHHFRRPHRTIVCVIELISSACRTTQDALSIVTLLLGPRSRVIINSS